MVTSTRLKCSKHDVYLVLRVHLVMRPSGCNRVEFWGCPCPDCKYVRARKDQKKLVKRRVMPTSHRSLKKKAHDPVSDFDKQYFFNF